MTLLVKTDVTHCVNRGCEGHNIYAPKLLGILPGFFVSYAVAPPLCPV